MFINGRLSRIAGKFTFAVAVLGAANLEFFAADPVFAAPTPATVARVTNNEAPTVRRSETTATLARLRGGASKLQFAVVRVTVSGNGHVEREHIAYHSGDPVFDQAALHAVAKTAFISNSRTAGPSTFDYVLITNADGTRVTRILGHLRGDRNVSTVASVHVSPSGDPWMAENDRRISAK